MSMQSISKNHFDEEFLLIWNAMARRGITPLAVAGGYGLLLKQRWLGKQQNPHILIPLERWKNPYPRATKDFDFVIDLDFLKNEQDQKAIAGILEKLGYTVSDRNPRWQFVKTVDGNEVVVEFHSESPDEDATDLESCRIRVKRRPSLKGNGIHGRKNPEAVGCNEKPFILFLEEQEILVPNPVTWSVMKLTAMSDQLDRSNDPDRNEVDRTKCRKQAAKHADDVCRIVAMISKQEANDAYHIADILRTDPVFIRACEIAKKHFSEDAEGSMMTESSWGREDHLEIRRVLGSWFTVEAVSGKNGEKA